MPFARSTTTNGKSLFGKRQIYMFYINDAAGIQKHYIIEQDLFL